MVNSPAGMKPDSQSLLLSVRFCSACTISGLGNLPKKQSGHKPGPQPFLERLKSRNQAPIHFSMQRMSKASIRHVPSKYLTAYPNRRPKTVKDDIAGNLPSGLVDVKVSATVITHFQQNYAQRQELLADIILILSNTDILQEVIRQGIPSATPSETVPRRSNGSPNLLTCSHDRVEEQ